MIGDGKQSAKNDVLCMNLTADERTIVNNFDTSEGIMVYLFSWLFHPTVVRASTFIVEHLQHYVQFKHEIFYRREVVNVKQASKEFHTSDELKGAY